MAMKPPLVQFTVRRLVLGMAAVGLALASSVACARWFANPYVNVTVRNNTSELLTDVRIIYRNREHRVDLLNPGHRVTWTIHSNTESDVVLRRFVPERHEANFNSPVKRGSDAAQHRQ
jgi:hypothetical protein